jgi:hypothetical protein
MGTLACIGCGERTTSRTDDGRPKHVGCPDNPLREAAERVAAAWQREYLDRGPGEFADAHEALLAALAIPERLISHEEWVARFEAENARVNARVTAALHAGVRHGPTYGHPPTDPALVVTDRARGYLEEGMEFAQSASLDVERLALAMDKADPSIDSDEEEDHAEHLAYATEIAREYDRVR